MEKNDLVPPLRADIELLPNEDNEAFPFVLNDPSIGQRIKLDPQGYTIASLLDRPQTISELFERLIDYGMAVKEETLPRVVRFFANYHLLHTPEYEAFMASRATEATHEVDLETVPLIFDEGEEDRFNCVMCGSCCGGHNVGPVEPDVLARLRDKKDELLKLTRSNKGLFFTVDVDEKETVVAQMDNGYCVFLEDNNHCLLHKHFGPEYKPGVCNVFPLHFAQTPEGVVVSFQMECRSYLRSKHAAKTPLREQQAEMRRILKCLPNLPRIRPIIPLDFTNSMTFAEYSRFEAQALTTIRSHRHDIRAAMAAVGELIEGERAQREIRPTIAMAGEDVLEYREQLLAFQARLLEDIDGLYEKHVKPDDKVRFGTRGLDNMRAAVVDLHRNLSLALRRHRSADAAELWYDCYRHYYFSKDATCYKSLLYGQGLFGLKYLLTYAMAVARAQAVARRYVEAQDVADALVMVNYLFRNKVVQGMLQEHTDQIVTLFHHQLHMLFEHTAAVQPTSTEFEFYLF